MNNAVFIVDDPRANMTGDTQRETQSSEALEAKHDIHLCGFRDFDYSTNLEEFKEAYNDKLNPIALLENRDIYIFPSNNHNSMLEAYNTIAHRALDINFKYPVTIKVVIPQEFDKIIPPETTSLDWIENYSSEELTQLLNNVPKYDGERVTVKDLPPIFEMRRGSQIPPETIEWLWYPYIAKKRITLVAADPGVGKSNILTWIAARVTTGIGFPTDNDLTTIRSKEVVFLTEDEKATTLLPRFRNNGGDDTRLVVSDAVKSINLPEDIGRIDYLVESSKPDLIVVDPFSKFYKNSNMNMANDIYAALEFLDQKAKQCNAAVVIIHHNNKQSGETKALYRAIGSNGIVGAVRSMLTVGKDPINAGNIAMAHTKSNLAPEGKTLSFKLIDNGRNESPTVKFDSVVNVTADQLVGAKVEEDNKDVLRGELAKRPLVKAILELINKVGVTVTDKKGNTTQAYNQWHGSGKEIREKFGEVEGIPLEAVPIKANQLTSELEQIKEPLFNLFGIRYDPRKSEGNATLHRFYRVGTDHSQLNDPDFTEL